jgi:hypothetical protein
MARLNFQTPPEVAPNVSLLQEEEAALVLSVLAPDTDD